MKVAVTGLNNVDNPGPGVPVIRSLKEAGIIDLEIIGLIYDSLEPGIYMEGVSDTNYLIPYPSAGLDSYFDRIAYINSIEKIDVIIPTLDAELFAYSKLEPKLRDLGIKMFLPTSRQLELRAKDQLSAFCDSNNIKSPRSYVVTSAQDLFKIPSDFNYPLAIKGIFYDAYIANNFDEASAYFNKISSKWGLPIIIQEFIRGEEYNVVALGDGKGNSVGAVSMKKMFITDKGKAWAGITINDPALINLSNEIIEKLEWRSGAELEFIKDSITNEYFLIEINPRFPAWVYLAIGAGQNLPYALLQMALGSEVEPFNGFEIGKIFIRYSWDLITDIKQFEQLTINGEYSHEKEIV